MRPVEFNPQIHRRRSIRLRGYDYSRPGFYFVTVCTDKKLHLFGEIAEWQMVLNSTGKMVAAWWSKLPVKFPGIEPDALAVMPNHVHGIIRIVGADPCVRPAMRGKERGARMGAPLPKIVQWFKTMSTNEYLRMAHDTRCAKDGTASSPKLWQRNYYEHIVRDDDELIMIRNYMRENPARWDADPENA